MAGRGKRGASLGKKIYPPQSFYIEFDEFGAATGENAGRFNTWFGNTVKARTPYYLEWKKMKKETHDQLKEWLWLHTMETWRFVNDNENAKAAQLSKVNGIHRTFRNALVEFVRLNKQPFDTYKYLPENLEHWEKFVAYTTSEEFRVKSEKAKNSALQNKDPARVGRSGYAKLRALWKTDKEKLIERIPLLGLLQSERSILHVLGRMKKNKETGIKDLTNVVRERLDALIKKENEMKANGTYYLTGNDPLIGVLGKEHGGRTRSVSSTQGSKTALGSNKGEMMQKVSMKDLEGMAGKIMAEVKPEMDQLRADIATLKKISDGMPIGVSGHITVDRFDEIEYCEVMSIHFGTEVKVGKGIIYPTNVHGVPMEPGYMKIQVDTVYPGWEGLKVPRPTDEVMFLGDATKDARFIQWPKDYLKVVPRKSSSLDSMSRPSSSPSRSPQCSPLDHPTTSSSSALYHPTMSSSPPLYHQIMSEPNNCDLQVEEQLPSLDTMSQGAPKKINPSCSPQCSPLDHSTTSSSLPLHHSTTTSSPTLYHPTMSCSPPLYHPIEPNYDLETEEQLPSLTTLSQDAPKKIPPKKPSPKQKNIPRKQKNLPPKQKTPPKQKLKKNHTVLPQKESSTIDKYSKVLAKRPMNIRNIAEKFINKPKSGDFILVPAHNGLYDEFYTDRIFYESVLGWMSNDWLDGTILHWWGMHLYRLVQNGFKGENKCGILNPSEIDFRLCRTHGDKVLKHIKSTLSVQQDKTIFIAPYLQCNHWVLVVICPLTKTGYILDSLNKSWDKEPSMYYLTPLVEAACHDTSSSSRDWNWNMVKCPQQEAMWECGYYVAIAMFELFYKLQSNFPHNVWNDINPRSARHIDEWVENSVPQFYSTYFSKT